MKRKIGIYLSGSISHDPDFMKKFALAERLIKETLPEAFIFNPAAHQYLPTEGKTEEELWADYLCRDLVTLITISDKFRMRFLISMPGHRTSKGSSLERAFAEHLGFRIMDIREYFPDWDKQLAAEFGGQA